MFKLIRYHGERSGYGWFSGRVRRGTRPAVIGEIAHKGHYTFTDMYQLGEMPMVHWLLTTNPICRYVWPNSKSARFFARSAKMIQGRLQNENGQGHSDFVTKFMEAKEKHPDVVTDRIAITYGVSNLVAGSDTTGTALTSMFYFLMKNPGIMKRLQDEIDQADLSFPVDFRTTQGLPFLNAVMQESMRMHPVISAGFERVVPAGGMQLSDGTKLPEGTKVNVDPWTTNFDKAVFGNDAETFNPDRYLQGLHETDESYKSRMRGMKAADLIWGKGSRACLGKHVAYLEMFKLLATLLGLFDVRLHAMAW